MSASESKLHLTVPPGFRRNSTQPKVTQPVRYATAASLRQALEACLMNLARAEQVDVQRLRRQLAFDRLPL
jgi:hypothetical protein